MPRPLEQYVQQATNVGVLSQRHKNLDPGGDGGVGLPGERWTCVVSGLAGRAARDAENDRGAAVVHCQARAQLGRRKAETRR